MLQISAFKQTMIWLTCVVGLLLALPNGFYSTVEKHNDAAVCVEAGQSNEQLRPITAFGRISCPLVWLIWVLICAAVRICWPKCRWIRFTPPSSTACGLRCAIRWPPSVTRWALSSVIWIQPEDVRVSHFRSRRRVRGIEHWCADWRSRVSA